MRLMEAFHAIELVEGFGPSPGSEDELVEAWQYLHDSGLAYQLQGSYGRMAQSLLAAGVIVDREAA